MSVYEEMRVTPTVADVFGALQNAKEDARDEMAVTLLLIPCLTTAPADVPEGTSGDGYRRGARTVKLTEKARKSYRF